MTCMSSQALRLMFNSLKTLLLCSPLVFATIADAVEANEATAAEKRLYRITMYERGTKQRAYLAELHRDLGVKIEHFDFWLDALVETLREIDPKLSPDEEVAWRVVLGPGVELCRTRYDLHAAAARIRATAYPQAEEFAARSVLSPPTEREMLDAFARAEITDE